MKCRGTVKNGVIVPDRAGTLPEGARVQVRTGRRARCAKRHAAAPGLALLRFAGKANGLPSDLAENHDHYLHGLPKRKRRGPK
jgi:hypothetical protein